MEEDEKKYHTLYLMYILKLYYYVFKLGYFLDFDEYFLDILSLTNQASGHRREVFNRWHKKIFTRLVRVKYATGGCIS